jgi:hypothetical protein
VKRGDFFGCRMSMSERKLLSKVAIWLELTDSETVRLLIHEKAREIGVERVKDDKMQHTC